MELRTRALEVLCIADPAVKATAMAGAWADPATAAHSAIAAGALPEPAGLPGRPPRPQLVPPKDVPQRSPFTPVGYAGLIHAICHIEFNAIKIS